MSEVQRDQGTLVHESQKVSMLIHQVAKAKRYLSLHSKGVGRFVTVLQSVGEDSPEMLHKVLVPSPNRGHKWLWRQSNGNSPS